MMISKKGYQPLDADRKAYVRHGRDGLPAVWSKVVEVCSSGPEAGRREGCGMQQLEECSLSMLKNAMYVCQTKQSDVRERATSKIVCNGKARALKAIVRGRSCRGMFLLVNECIAALLLERRRRSSLAREMVRVPSACTHNALSRWRMC